MRFIGKVSISCYSSLSACHGLPTFDAICRPARFLRLACHRSPLAGACLLIVIFARRLCHPATLSCAAASMPRSFSCHRNVRWLCIRSSGVRGAVALLSLRLVCLARAAAGTSVPLPYYIWSAKAGNIYCGFGRCLRCRKKCSQAYSFAMLCTFLRPCQPPGGQPAELKLKCLHFEIY